MPYYRIIDDIEAGTRRFDLDGDIVSIRDGYPSTVRIHGGSNSVKLSREWMIYVNRINGIDGCKYQFVDFENYPTCHIFKPSVGWHNKGYDNLIEQLTFSGNIVEVTSIVDNRAYIRSFYNDQMPPAPIWPDKDHLDTRVQLFTTQFKTKLDMTTDGRYPRTLIIANPGENLWMDIADLRPIEQVIPPENEVDMTEIIGGIKMHKGIDTSKYNAVIDWPALSAQGLEFAIIRSGQGTGYKDPLFATHRDNATRNGTPWSIYHFYDYRWPDGELHFKNMQSVVGTNFGNLPSCVDLETLYTYTATKATPVPLPARNTVYNELMEFGRLLKIASGRKPMLYVGNLLGWLKPDQSFMDMFDLWFANWNPYERLGSFAPWKNWLCWQRLGDVKLTGQVGVWDINYVKDADWQYFTGQNVPPVVTEPTDSEKLKRLWDAHPELHTA